MKKLDVILLLLGVTINCVVGIHFGIQYLFLSMAAELIICGLLLIKFCDKYKKNYEQRNKIQRQTSR
nr:MAG TPA: protein of unknown function (DUF5325) [Caudoviricetes sp.]